MDPLALLSLSGPAIRAIRRAVKGRVAVSPAEMAFGGSDWQTCQTLMLSNLREEPAYDTLVAIWSANRPVLERLPLVLQTVDGHEQRAVAKSRDGFGFAYDQFSLEGTSSGHGVVLLFRRELAPKQTVRLELRGKGRKRFHVWTEVLRAEKKPELPAFAERDGDIAIPFNLPIPLKLHTLSIYVDRT